jgi:hypothetical protein
VLCLIALVDTMIALRLLPLVKMTSLAVFLSCLVVCFDGDVTHKLMVAWQNTNGEKKKWVHTLTAI